MERLSEIEGRTAMEKRRLERLHRALEEECGAAPRCSPRRWRALAEHYSFDAINELIRQHNDWYPIERDLAMDPRTRDFVLIHGRSYRRTELGPEWILEHFPASPPEPA